MKKTKRLMELEQKAEGGNLKAIEKLGERYADLRRKFLDKGDAPKWIVEGLEKVVNLYDENGIEGEGKDAVFQLAQEYALNDCGEKSKKSCWLYIEFLGLATNETKRIALNNLACRFEYGIEVPKDEQLSLGLFKLLTFLGHSYGKLNLAEYYEEGRSTEKDTDKAIELYKELITNDFRDGSKERSREKLAKLGFTECALDELENEYQLELVDNYMKSNFVWIELTDRIRIWSADVEDTFLTAQLQDEGIITNEKRMLLEEIRYSGKLKYRVSKARDCPPDMIKEREIKAIRRFRPKFGAWADAWEGVLSILEKERITRASEKTQYYFVIKNPDANPQQNSEEDK